MGHGAGCRGWDPGFTAAYFDHSGLYCFGRQPEALHWNCGQLAVALRLLAETEPLVFALERFGGLYQQAMVRRFIWRLGVSPRREDADLALVAAAEQHMLAAAISPDAFFHMHRGGRQPPEGEFGELLRIYAPAGEDGHDLWREAAAPDLHIDEVERLWSAIDEHDDWQPLERKLAEIRGLADALGEAPAPAAQ